jgi:long-subunit fatty acid transport protein
MPIAPFACQTATAIGSPWGARYELSRAIAIDVAYAHLFFDDAPIHNISPSPAPPGVANTVSGEFRSSLDIVGIQMVLGF